MSDEIEGQVATILNGSEVIINRGSRHGVIQGMKFAILDEESRPVRDPESGDVIHYIPVAKTVVKVVATGDVWAQCKTFRTKVTSSFLAGLTPGAERRETFHTEGLSEVDRLGADTPAVTVGDRVLEYSGEFPGIVRNFY